MTALSKASRQKVVLMAMRDAYAPRFSELRGKLVEVYTRQLAEAHPVFVKLTQDKEARQYLAMGHKPRIRVSGNSRLLGEPDYRSTEPQPPHRSYSVSDAGWVAFDMGVVEPQTFEGVKLPEDHKLVLAHDKLWAEYMEAYAKLTALLYSYSNREKFQVDFPELAKYLPAIETKPKLPMVIVEEVKKDLAKFGIPPAKGKIK